MFVAVLRCEATGRRISLGARCLVGRSQLAHLQIADPTISAEHASVYFDGSQWKLRDLASRNGTFTGSGRIDPQRSVVLEGGASVRFGSNDSNTWVLECSQPPGPSAVSSGGERVLSSHGVLWLPDADLPEACVHHADGTWVLDTHTGARVVADGDVVAVDGRRYTLELPPERPAAATSPVDSTLDAGLDRTLCLTFVISQDEEHVSLKASVGSQVFDLGARAHNYPLLVLARRRQEESSRGVATGEAGWLYSHDLFAMLQANREAVNLLLWRATQCFKKAGLPGERLIERRLDSGQVRIGIEELTILRSPPGSR